MTETIRLDCRGMRCPAPILEVAKVARKAGKNNQLLEIFSDDDDFPADIEAWCRTVKARLRGVAKRTNTYRAQVELNPLPLPNANGTQTNRRPAVRPISEPMGARIALPTNPSSIIQDLTTNADLQNSKLAASKQPDTTPSAALIVNGHNKPTPTPAPAPASLVPIKQTADVPPPINRSIDRYRNSNAVVKKSGIAPATIPANGKLAAHNDSGMAASKSNNIINIEAPHDVPCIDLRGMGAPEPILRLADLLQTNSGKTIEVICDDQHFVLDLASWCSATRVEIATISREKSVVTAVLNFPDYADVPVYPHIHAHVQPEPEIPQVPLAPEPDQPKLLGGPPMNNQCTLMIQRNDFESLMAAFMVAERSRAMGMEVAMFFTFWGINLLRAEKRRTSGEKSNAHWMQSMLQWMMPKGPKRQQMSKMNMGGMGPTLLEYFMKKNEVSALPELMDSLVNQNVKFIVCTTSMCVMGVQEQDLVDLPNMEYGEIEAFVKQAQKSRINLVF